MKVMLLKPFPTYFNMFTYNIYQISFVISMTYTCVAIIWLFGTHPPNGLDEEDTNMMVLRFYATWP